MDASSLHTHTAHYSVQIPALPAQYERRSAGWIHFAYFPSARERIDSLLHHAEEMKARLTDDLRTRVLERVDVRLASTYEEMCTLAPLGAAPPSYAVGVAYPGLHLILLTWAAPNPSIPLDLEEVLRHELAHIALADATLEHPVPRWLNEGFAIYESAESRFARMKTLWDATLSQTLLPLHELDAHFPKDHYDVNIAYAQSADFLRFLFHNVDQNQFVTMIAHVRRGDPFPLAWTKAYTVELETLEQQWYATLRMRYGYMPLLTGSSVLWMLIIGLFGIGWFRKKRRARAVLAQWEAEEAAIYENMTEPEDPILSS